MVCENRSWIVEKSMNFGLAKQEGGSYVKYINARIFQNGIFARGNFEVCGDRFGSIELYKMESKSAAGYSDDVNGGFTEEKISYKPNRLNAKMPCNVKTGCVGETAACRQGTDEVIDLKGALVIPGLIDIHGHGNSGYDFTTCNLEGLKKIASYLGKNGITSFAPASMTAPYEVLEQAFQNALALHDIQECHTAGMSRLLGINMEGPYFSYGKRGAQDPAWLKAPDMAGFLNLYNGCQGLIRMVDIAPELEGAMDFIKTASQFCRVSIAHTEADYETAREAFACGANHVTHLFNGMKGIHHRDPGLVCAAFDTPGVFVEMICDGVHIAPPVIRMVFELFRGRVILISDALACCGMSDGNYKLGDQEFCLKDRHAFLPDGTLAGSASNLFDMIRNVVSFGIPLEEAVKSATINPARQMGMESELGSIEERKKADFLICSESLQLQSVYIDGMLVR